MKYEMFTLPARTWTTLNVLPTSPKTIQTKTTIATFFRHLIWYAFNRID